MISLPPMTVAQLKDLVELVMLVVACVSPVVWIVLEKRIDARLEQKLESVHADVETLTDSTENLDGRVSALEWFREHNAANINQIPRSLAILERLEETLDQLNSTMGDLRVSVARLQGGE
jgi:hypothetical protein